MTIMFTDRYVCSSKIMLTFVLCSFKNSNGNDFWSVQLFFFFLSLGLRLCSTLHYFDDDSICLSKKTAHFSVQ